MELTTNQHPQQEQYKDFKEILQLFTEAEYLCADVQRFDKATDELYKYQPFLISLALGDIVDIGTEEVNEMMVMYVMLWLYFKRDLKALNIKITDDMFSRYYDANLAILAARDVDAMRMTVLWALCGERFQNRPVFAKMDHQAKSAVMVGVKTLIDCFEEIISDI